MRESLNGSYATTALHAMTIYDRQHSGISLSCNVPRFRTRTITGTYNVARDRNNLRTDRVVRKKGLLSLLYIQRMCAEQGVPV